MFEPEPDEIDAVYEKIDQQRAEIRRLKATIERLSEGIEVAGWAIVPLQPTIEMRQAGEPFCEGSSDRAVGCYLAMLAARPRWV